MTGSSPGWLSRTCFSWARQRSPSTYNVSTATSPPAHVQRESLVEQRRQRQVPLAGVLHRLAPGADLELDQPHMRVLRVERLGDATQVVDVGAERERVADHLPLDRVRPTHLALLGGGGTVGVPRVAADADPDRGRNEIALVTGQVEADPVGLLGEERREHRVEVR